MRKRKKVITFPEIRTTGLIKFKQRPTNRTPFKRNMLQPKYDENLIK